MKKILSISIAAYNVEKYIKETLDSLVIERNMDALEVLIVSDGSTDNTNSIAKEFVDEYPDVFKLIKKDNGGWGSTVNVGLSNASGKYFKQLDGDDYFKNLDAFIDFLRNAEEDMILTPFVSFDDKSKRILEKRFYNEFENIKFPTKIEYIAEQYKGMNMHAACFKTELLKQNNIHIEEKCFYTDVDLMIQACSVVNTVNFFPLEIYYYRISGDGQSCSISGYIKHYDEHYKISLKCLKNSYKYSGNEKIKRMLIDRSNIMASFQYFIALECSPSITTKNSIKHFDEILKEEYFDSYIYMNSIKRIRLLRMFDFYLLPLLHYICRKKDGE